MNNNSNIINKLALGLIPNIGNVTVKKLIAFLGSVDAIFEASRKDLLKIPGIGTHYIQHLDKKEQALKRAEEELSFIQKNNIKFVFYTDADYPFRLKNCEDNPIGLFYKGEISKNDKIISIVGTRKATKYGLEICENLIAELKDYGYNPIIISGLAYGIDACAHKSALKNELKTYAVLGNGLHTIYPGTHRNLADKIEQNGAVISEFYSHSKLDKNNFVKRNRIIAGLSDATIVVESREKGGALITADIANSYNRDVLTFPGRANDESSAGCNWLIKTNRAALIEKASDLEYILGWDREKNTITTAQKSLFVNLSPEEQTIVNFIKENKNLEIDKICLMSQMPVSKVSAMLLNLEFEGIVKCLPGKVYKLA
jgi:DNA processing protein